MASKKAWLWIIGGVIALGLIAVVLVGGFAYFAYRQMSFEAASQESAAAQFTGVRARFKEGAYIELDPVGRTFRIHRELEGDHETDLQAIHILAWDADKAQLVRLAIPFWLVRLNSSAAFRLPVGNWNEQFRVTASDLARRGPGIILDVEEPGGTRVIVWAE